MKEPPDVVVLGAHGSGGNMVHVDHVPVPGESIIAKDFQVFKDGGKGAHQAMVVGRLGGSAAFIGKIAVGPRNDAARQWLIDDGVDVRHLLRQGEESPHAGLIMLDRDGVSTIVSIPGLRHKLTFEEAGPCIEDFAGASLFITGFEIPVDTALRGAKLAKDLGMRTILNPAPISTEPLGMLDYIDIVIPNEAEARGLAGTDLRSATDPTELARLIRKRHGIETVIITLGSAGVCCLDGDRTWQFDAVETEAVNTTGAGDVFIGSFAWALMDGRTTADAVLFANCAAAISVSRPGTIDSFPTRNEVEELFSEHLMR